MQNCPKQDGNKNQVFLDDEFLACPVRSEEETASAFKKFIANDWLINNAFEPVAVGFLSRSIDRCKKNKTGDKLRKDLKRTWKGERRGHKTRISAVKIVSRRGESESQHVTFQSALATDNNESKSPLNRQNQKWNKP